MTALIAEAKLLALVLDLFDIFLRPSDVLCDYGLTERDLKLLQRAMSDFFDREIDWSDTTAHNSIRQLATHASIKLEKILNLNEFVNKYELVLRALARISIPDWRIIARVEHNVQFAERFCLKRFVLTAVNKSPSVEFDVTLDTWVKHTLEMFDDDRGHNYEVLVGVNVKDLKGAQPIELVEIAYKSSDGLLLVGDKQDDFQTLDEWLEVIIDSITQIKVRL